MQQLQEWWCVKPWGQYKENNRSGDNRSTKKKHHNAAIAGVVCEAMGAVQREQQVRRQPEYQTTKATKGVGEVRWRTHHNVVETFRSLGLAHATITTTGVKWTATALPERYNVNAK
jgi:hypothetical protein